jgi:hypothetical protein
VIPGEGVYVAAAVEAAKTLHFSLPRFVWGNIPRHGLGLGIGNQSNGPRSSLKHLQ